MFQVSGKDVRFADERVGPFDCLSGGLSLVVEMLGDVEEFSGGGFKKPSCQSAVGSCEIPGNL